MKTPIFALSVIFLLILTISARADEPSAEHLADLEIWIESKDTSKTFPAADRLREALKAEGAEGEVLAQHILGLVDRAKENRRDVIHLLYARAFTIDEDQNIIPHLDGPYLKKLAQMSVPDDANHREIHDHHGAVAYLKLHPEDHELYWRLRLAATRDAKISHLPKDDRRLLEEKDLPDHEKIRDYVRAHFPEPIVSYSLRDAWAILLQLEVLKPGMTVEEAEKILGERYRKEEKPKIEDGWIRWYHDSPRHVNPNLGAEVKGGKIVKFRSGNA